MVVAQPTLPRLKAGYYAFTALGTIASSYYFNYLFFFLRDRFGFGNRENLGVAALHGAIYVVSAWQCGKFAERRGYHTSLKIGYATLCLCMVAGALARSAAAQVAVLAVYSVVLLFIWPALEALTTEHEPPSRVPHVIGVYNCTWAGAVAFAYFTGGGLYAWWGKGALFLLPAAIFLLQFVLAFPLERASRRIRWPHGESISSPSPESGPVDPRLAARSATFLTLAWVANPFSYVAMYTLFAVMPVLAERLGLSAAEVGLFGSVWLFSRLVAFAGLWQWTAWHYRFRWLAGGYALLTGSFVAIVLVPSLVVVVIAQVAFGISCGLMYYSSLFYSMDVGEAKAEHGGLHEAAIGAGIFAGPAVGAASLQFFPHYASASATAVTALLVVGFGVLMAVWTRGGDGMRRPDRRER